MSIARRYAKLAGTAVAVVFAGLTFQSCFTGIEHTGHISLSKKDKEISHRISREESFMLDIKGDTATFWESGRKFLVVGERAAFVFDNPPENPVGKTLSYRDHKQVLTPAGTYRVQLCFIDSAGAEYRYLTTRENIGNVVSSELPMLIDLTQIGRLADKLRDRHLWIKTEKWLDEEGRTLTGCKYEPVTVTGVRGGSENLPFLITFVDSSGRTASVRMSQSEGALASRPFHTLFALEDPRASYPTISDDVWENIRHARVAEGMNKQECRLALGNPDNIESGRDYSKTIESWTYANGIFLRFEDGLLVYFRK